MALSKAKKLQKHRSERLEELDGIRGWAAFSVVVFHIFWETFGAIHPSFRNLFAATLLNGRLAVAVFFVLSGESLSAAYFSGCGEIAVIALALKRYTRLTIPVFVSSAIVFILLRWNVMHIAEASSIIHRPDWLGAFLTHAPNSVRYLLIYSAFDVYAALPASAHLNPFLWTMHYEMIGSLLVFAVLLCFRRVRYAVPLLLAAAAGLTIANEGFPNYACFLVGICISAARADGVFHRIQNLRWSQPLSWLAFVAVAAASGAAHSMGLLNDRTIIFAVPLLLIIFCNRPLIRFFSSRISRFLGSISFPIYLLQFPVIATFTAGQIVKAVSAGGLSSVTIWYIGLTSFVICVVAAIAFLPVEVMTRRVGNRIVGALIKPESLATAPATFWDVGAPSPRGAEFIQP